jgi:DNA-binding MarR family transcriptional regulator
VSHQLAVRSGYVASPHLFKQRLRGCSLGLTYSQYLVMLALWEHAELGVGELGERLHLDNGTLTPLLKRMERDDLVRRRRDAQDERRVRITLTAHGRKLRAKALHVPQALAGQLGMSPAGVADLRDAVQAMVRVLAVQHGPSSSP